MRGRIKPLRAAIRPSTSQTIVTSCNGTATRREHCLSDARSTNCGIAQSIENACLFWPMLLHAGTDDEFSGRLKSLRSLKLPHGVVDFFPY